MAVYMVDGGNRLEGSVPIHGAKNSALPILAAAVNCGPCVIENCPRLSDIEVSLDILEHLGCRTTREGTRVCIEPGTDGDYCIPEHLMCAMRSSIVFLGGILAKFGKAEMTLPGGCELGARPIDIHLASLRKMGAKIVEDGGLLLCDAANGLSGTDIVFPFPSVGATENVLIAAATAKGRTRIIGAAREPEIGDLITFLSGCGAQIELGIDGIITIDGVRELHGYNHSVIPDRIVAGTILCAAAVTGGEVEITNVKPAHLLTTMAYLHNAGCKVKTRLDSILLKAPERMNELGIIKTQPYPGFPTDMQAILMAVATRADGTSVFVENIFDGRYRHVGELLKLGADIKLVDRVAVVTGVADLKGAQLRCTDLRGGAAAIVAALSAKGRSEIKDIWHVERGYEDFTGNLTVLGAKIRRGDDQWIQKVSAGRGGVNAEQKE